MAVSHSRPPHLRDPRLSQRTSLLSCALPPPHRSPPYPPRFPQVRPTVPASVRPTVPASVRTTDSPTARRSFSVGKCCAVFRSPISELPNIRPSRINIRFFPLKLPHEAHPEIKPEIPGRKTEISCTQPCPAGWRRQGMVIFMRIIHILLCGLICHFMQSIALFLCCLTHCSAPSIAALYFARIIVFAWFVALFLWGRYRASHAVLSLFLSVSH